MTIRAEGDALDAPWLLGQWDFDLRCLEVPDRFLSGLAWGENIGWIDFGGGAMASPANPARFDTLARRFRGYAWGENIGWINLDDDTHFVSTACPADFNLSGAVSVQDIFDFLAAYFALEAAADFNLSGAVTVQAIFDFLAAYFAGCV